MTMKRYFRILVSVLMISALTLSGTSCKKKESPTFHRPEEKDDPGKGGAFDVEVGKALPAWEEGVLDIHAINTARGECTYIILPDGTTMVVDAGDLYNYTPSGYENDVPKPDKSAEPYKVYGAYINKYLPSGHNHIDYANISHYHIDHYGASTTSGRTKDAQGGYTLAGITGLYSIVPFDKLIDRSYPQYDLEGVENIAFYKDFVKYREPLGLKVEKFKLGTSEQFALKYNKDKYSNCKIVGYAQSGIIWDGSKEVDTKMTNENALSCAMLLSYGKFDYFTSGDLNNNTPCSAIANAIGRKVEAMKCHHHMSNEGSFKTENNIYQPKVIVTQSFYVRAEQPQQPIINAYAEGQDMFFTNIDQTLLTAAPAIYNKAKGINGHVVIRVVPGGDSFYVYMMDDTNYDYIVTSIHGPYSCFE